MIKQFKEVSDDEPKEDKLIKLKISEVTHYEDKNKYTNTISLNTLEAEKKLKKIRIGKSAKARLDEKQNKNEEEKVTNEETLFIVSR